MPVCSNTYTYTHIYIYIYIYIYLDRNDVGDDLMLLLLFTLPIESALDMELSREGGKGTFPEDPIQMYRDV